MEYLLTSRKSSGMPGMRASGVKTAYILSNALVGGLYVMITITLYNMSRTHKDVMLLGAEVSVSSKDIESMSNGFRDLLSL